VDIITSQVPIKGKVNPGAFRGELLCPYCRASKWDFVENASRYRIRYRCKKCHKTIIYDFTNNPGHPYEVYGKGKFRQLVETWKNNKGRKPFG